MDQLLRDLTRLVLAGRTLEEVLGDIVAIANREVPGAESTSITLVRDDKAFTAAHFGEMSLAADELQYEEDGGPCMDAGRGGVVLRVDDMRTEERWPDYVPRVLATGVRSSLSVPLPYQGSSIGALNLYATKPRAFDRDIPIGEEIASYIAVAIANADAYAEAATLARNMQEAMHSRADIEMAKGILMAQQHCSPDEAFALLSKASQRSNRRLRDLAHDIVANVTDRAASSRTDASQDSADSAAT